MKKKILLILFIVNVSFTSGNGQNDLKNNIWAKIGYGFSDDSYTIKSFGFGYQRDIYKSLFVRIEYSTIQGNETFESIIGETPVTNQYHEFSDLYSLPHGVESAEGVPARLLQIKSWSIGLTKYVMLSPKIQMFGGISLAHNSVLELDIAGLEYDDLGNVIIDDIYPQYSDYSKVGSKVDFGVLLNINKQIALVAQAEYQTFFSIFSFSIGSSVSF